MIVLSYSIHFCSITSITSITITITITTSISITTSLQYPFAVLRCGVAVRWYGQVSGVSGWLGGWLGGVVTVGGRQRDGDGDGFLVTRWLVRKSFGKRVSGKRGKLSSVASFTTTTAAAAGIEKEAPPIPKKDD